MHHGPIYRHGTRFLSWLIPIILILLIISVLYILFKKKSPNEGKTSIQKESEEVLHSHAALKILNERYAKGELKDEEYLRMKKNLLNTKDNEK